MGQSALPHSRMVSRRVPSAAADAARVKLARGDRSLSAAADWVNDGKSPKPFCRRLARTLSEVEGERLENHPPVRQRVLFVASLHISRRQQGIEASKPLYGTAKADALP